MLDAHLTKYHDFKACVEKYFNEEVSKDEMLDFLEFLRTHYEEQHSAILDHVTRNKTFHQENRTWIATLREAIQRFENARDAIEEIILDDSDDIDEALELFKEGNQMLCQVDMELDEQVERTSFRGFEL